MGLRLYKATPSFIFCHRIDRNGEHWMNYAATWTELDEQLLAIIARQRQRTSREIARVKTGDRLSFPRATSGANVR